MSSYDVSMEVNSRISTITTSNGVAYSDGDQIGSLITYSFPYLGAYSLMLTYATMGDKDKQNSDINLWFFNTDPGLTSVNNGPLAFADGSLAYFEGILNISASRYVNTVANSVSDVFFPNVVVKTSTVGNLYMIAQSAGTPTYTTTTSLILNVKFNMLGKCV